MKLLAAVTLMGIGMGMVAPSVTDACAIKDNDIAIVVGMVGGEVATLRIALHEQERGTSDSMVDTEWSGAATLVVGTTRTAIGRIDPKRSPALEIDRLTVLARDRAAKLAGFVAASQIDQTDCSEAPADRCGTARLSGTTLSVERARATVEADRSITGVVRYRAGDTDIAVVNIGTGDPRFVTSVRPCSAQGCRAIPTLHHGAQTDVVVVTRRGT